MMITWSYFEEHDKPSKKINQRPWPRQDQIFTTTRRTKDTTIVHNRKETRHSSITYSCTLRITLLLPICIFFLNVFVLFILFFWVHPLYLHFLYRHHHHYHHHLFVISNMRLKTGNQNANHHLRLFLIYEQRDCTNVRSKNIKSNFEC